MERPSISGNPRPELSSIATALGDLVRRVTAIAERSSGTELDNVATELFEVERSLGEGHRRLTRVVERLRR